MFMRKIFLIFTFLSVALLGLQAEEKQGVYIFGASYSFTDSIVYFTEIQYLENVQLENKTKFIPYRQRYSYELKDFMSVQNGMPGRISAVYFSQKEASLKKKEAKLKKKIEKKDKMVVRYLGDKFKFTSPK